MIKDFDHAQTTLADIQEQLLDVAAFLSHVQNMVGAICDLKVQKKVEDVPVTPPAPHKAVVKPIQPIPPKPPCPPSQTPGEKVMATTPVINPPTLAPAPTLKELLDKEAAKTPPAPPLVPTVPEERAHEVVLTLKSPTPPPGAGEFIPEMPVTRKLAADGRFNPNWTPLCNMAILIGRSLPEPFFTVADLGDKLDGDPRAYHWIAQWKRSGWISTTTRGSYQLTEKFKQQKTA